MIPSVSERKRSNNETKVESRNKKWVERETRIIEDKRRSRREVGRCGTKHGVH